MSSQGPRSEELQFPFCQNATDKYEKLAKIGQGTFGEVFKARERASKSKVVAMKRVLLDNEKEGFPITALREIKILQQLHHENIVHLIEICRTRAGPYNRYKSTFYLVCEFCEHDLAGLLSNLHVQFSLGEKKMLMQQLLNGLYFIHNNNILHRDMKSANILITRTGILKLADFGLARVYSQKDRNRLTNRVVTLWYRPPELLLGARVYGPEIDIWGAGCIMAELWTRFPIMQGHSEQEQLRLISQLCGSIRPEIWPGVEKLDLYGKVELYPGLKSKVRDRLMPFLQNQYAVDLLEKMLSLNPSNRIDSDTALNHDFFWTDPMPTDLMLTMSKYNTSMFEMHAPKRRGQWTNLQQQRQQQHSHMPPDGQHFERIF
ncbi:hypothetical protein C0Q70_18236 [Pomacea canaliculata]|uniref:Protein kinase domain-containing protein n=1 Tax=Pomacea canaliculata TaxID=400727 RepID=A0A2T7NMN7_POMCA|nr:cyclin-dependent kinase 9-like isoform X2 [Pomacea canaliculata]PVD22424.1 hypothetical protein C0Q70_18236 [Pomacea canaliculata]